MTHAESAALRELAARAMAGTLHGYEADVVGVILGELPKLLDDCERLERQSALRREVIAEGDVEVAALRAQVERLTSERDEARALVRLIESSDDAVGVEEHRLYRDIGVAITNWDAEDVQAKKEGG